MQVPHHSFSFTELRIPIRVQIPHAVPIPHRGADLATRCLFRTQVFNLRSDANFAPKGQFRTVGANSPQRCEFRTKVQLPHQVHFRTQAPIQHTSANSAHGTNSVCGAGFATSADSSLRRYACTQAQIPHTGAHTDAMCLPPGAHSGANSAHRCSVDHAGAERGTLVDGLSRWPCSTSHAGWAAVDAMASGL